MQFLKKIFFTILRLLLVWIFLCLSAGDASSIRENNFHERAVEGPTVTPVDIDRNNLINPREERPQETRGSTDLSPREINYRPIEESNLPLVKRGLVSISAYLDTCRGRLPFYGALSICQKNVSKPVCWQVVTNKWGQGKIWVPTGTYEMKDDSWVFTPSSFQLFDRSFIQILAAGAAHPLNCSM